MVRKMVMVIITLMGLVYIFADDVRSQDKILNKKISVNYENESLSSVVKNLNKKFGGIFSYREDLLKLKHRVTLKESNKSLKFILDKVFTGTKIGFKEFGGKIILNSKKNIKKITLSGSITDKSNGELLIGANVYIKGTTTGASTNQYGFYSLTLDKGIYTIVISFIGYKTQTISSTRLDKSMRLNIELEPSSVNIEEVVVEEKRLDHNVTALEMGVDEFSPKNLEVIPVLFGEQDILKTIQLMPGVSPAGEGKSGFFVRGGAKDQNQILLDEANVYNPSHLLGFFSTFNSDAINKVKIIKGNFPAEYGGKLASVMDVKMIEGNKKKYDVYGGIGLIASRLAVGGPIVKDKSSFIIAGRRTYADLFFPLFTSSSNSMKLYFYDFNAKANFVLGENDRLFISGYFGRDVLSFENKSNVFGLDWGNITSTVRWNHIFGDKLFMNLTGLYSKYDYNIKNGTAKSVLNVSSGIEDINLKADFQYFQSDISTIKFGAQVIKHKFSPGEISNTGTVQYNEKTIQKINAYESAVYSSHEYKFNEIFSVNYGLRLSNYSVVGPANVYGFDSDGNLISAERKNSGLIKSYWGYEPRVSAMYLLNNSNSIKAAYSRNMQYLHLVSNSSAGAFPLDIWQSSTNNIKPGISDQFSLGYFQNFEDNSYEFSIEGYYKKLQNQVDFRAGAELTLNEYVEGELVFGKGQAYGVEVLLKKNSGNFTGWIGYTLSRSEREFPDIDGGKAFPAAQDRTHDISIVGIYKMNETWSFSFNWVYNTGNAVTFPSGKYFVEGNIVNYYTQRNGYRMPAYHRLDLGATYTISESQSINISLYNAYGRKNAFAISFREKTNNPNQTEAVRYALFSFFPSITYNFRF
ncbi:MAG: TonB-dependent receptor domain-containing protein [Rhodothermaceae bacterium]